jgi:hypothetical protein
MRGLCQIASFKGAEKSPASIIACIGFTCGRLPICPTLVLGGDVVAVVDDQGFEGDFLGFEFQS